MEKEKTYSSKEEIRVLEEEFKKQFKEKYPEMSEILEQLPSEEELHAMYGQITISDFEPIEKPKKKKKRNKLTMRRFIK